MITRLGPKVHIKHVDGRYTLDWGVYELGGLTFEESERALDEIHARTFDPARWKNCREKIAFIGKQKGARGLGGHAA